MLRLASIHKPNHPRAFAREINSGRLLEKLNYLGSHPGFRASPASALLRLLAWRSYCALGISGSINLTNWKVRMQLPPEWRGISKMVFAFREHYEEELGYLASILSLGDVFIDVGAGYGIYSLLAAQQVGESGRILAFEPSAQAFAVLGRNIALNNLTNVIERRIALADRIGTTSLFLHADGSRNSLGGDGSAGARQSVETRTLDEELASACLNRVDVIKIDAEGAEELVLRGAKHALASSHPMVIFEVNPEAASQLGLKAGGAWNLLRRHGYRFWQLDDFGYLQSLASPPAFGNVVAIPRHT